MTQPLGVRDVQVDSRGVIQSYVYGCSTGGDARVSLNAAVYVDVGAALPSIGVVCEIFLDPDHPKSMADPKLQLRIMWLYRTFELTRKVKKLEMCAAHATRQTAGGGEAKVSDKTCKEVFMSNHYDTVPAGAVHHPIKVWYLPGTDAIELHRLRAPKSPVLHHFLPGFVCRQYWDPVEERMYDMTRTWVKDHLETEHATQVLLLLDRTKAELAAITAS